MAEPVAYLKCERTGRKYKIVARDRSVEPNILTLEGVNGRFDEPLRPVAEFAQMGYVLVIEEPQE